MLRVECLFFLIDAEERKTFHKLDFSLFKILTLN